MFWETQGCVGAGTTSLESIFEFVDTTAQRDELRGHCRNSLVDGSLYRVVELVLGLRTGLDESMRVLKLLREPGLELL